MAAEADWILDLSPRSRQRNRRRRPAEFMRGATLES